MFASHTGQDVYILRLIVHGISHDYKRVIVSILSEANELSSELGVLRPRESMLVSKLRALLLELEELLDSLANELEARQLDVPSALGKLESEIRPLLASVKSIADSIGRPLPGNKTAQSLNRLTRRATRQFDALISFSDSLTSGERRAVDKVQFSISSEINRICGDLRGEIERFGLDPQQFIQVRGNHTITQSQSLFSVVLSNLISNSLRHSNRRDGLRMEVVCQTLGANFSSENSNQDTPNFEIEVHDNGVGIPTSSQDAVFKLFYQGGQTRAPSSGTGTGLSFARTAAQAMGGDLKSIPCTQGAAFSFTIRTEHMRPS